MTIVQTNTPWDAEVFSSCEGKIDGFPEPANLTASVIVWLLGLYGLLMSQYNEFPTQVLYALITVWGSNAMAYHNTGEFQWYTSGNVMIYLVVWYTLGLVGERMFDLMFKQELHQRVSKSALAVGWVGAFSYTVAQLFQSGDAWGMGLSFSEALGISQLLTMLCTFISAYLLREKITKATINYLLVSGVIMFIMTVLWMSTEPNCIDDSTGKLKNDFLGYTRAFWYISTALGVHYIAQCTIKMELLTLNEPCDYNDSGNKWLSWMYYLLPLVTARKKPKTPKGDDCKKSVEVEVVVSEPCEKKDEE